MQRGICLSTRVLVTAVTVQKRMNRSFGMWTRGETIKTMYFMGCTLAPSSEYGSMIEYIYIEFGCYCHYQHR